MAETNLRLPIAIKCASKLIFALDISPRGCPEKASAVVGSGFIHCGQGKRVLQIRRSFKLQGGSSNTFVAKKFKTSRKL